MQTLFEILQSAEHKYLNGAIILTSNLPVCVAKFQGMVYKKCII